MRIEPSMRQQSVKGENFRKSLTAVKLKNTHEVWRNILASQDLRDLENTLYKNSQVAMLHNQEAKEPLTVSHTLRRRSDGKLILTSYVLVVDQGDVRKSARTKIEMRSIRDVNPDGEGGMLGFHDDTKDGKNNPYRAKLAFPGSIYSGRLRHN